ncbi:chaplin [Streptomyces sp. NBC_00239]|uniref:chaplin n=1 Tax=Streptomyces sp. NBC_00239 TaxID=2903640 RepID=UPI002E28C510|nr:chaplin [Streptomyces sp. NBC_00239]
MRQSRRNGLIAAVVASGALSVAGAAGYAFADTGAAGQAAGSPGLLSGNLVQLPVHVPVNACGNTVSVVGLLNPAAGNTCVNEGDHAPRATPYGSKPGPGPRNAGGAVAEGRGKDSPGVLSGNAVQLPVDLPVNVSGNSVNVVGVGNSSTGNTSVNGTEPGRSGAKPPQQPPRKPPVVRPVVAPPAPAKPVTPALAHTGADGLGYAAPAGAALLLGGAVLYRRFRPSAAR